MMGEEIREFSGLHGGAVCSSCHKPCIAEITGASHDKAGKFLVRVCEFCGEKWRERPKDWRPPEVEAAQEPRLFRFFLWDGCAKRHPACPDCFQLDRLGINLPNGWYTAQVVKRGNDGAFRVGHGRPFNLFSTVCRVHNSGGANLCDDVLAQLGLDDGDSFDLTICDDDGRQVWPEPEKERDEPEQPKEKPTRWELLVDEGGKPVYRQPKSCEWYVAGSGRTSEHSTYCGVLPFNRYPRYGSRLIVKPIKDDAEVAAMRAFFEIKPGGKGPVYWLNSAAKELGSWTGIGNWLNRLAEGWQRFIDARKG
jgi:hypothetical protein